jgi:large subunit ribosomal protein L22
MQNSLSATLKYALTSYKKMQLLGKLVAGKQVDEALVILEHTPKAAAKMLWKVVKSAQANAVNNAGKDTSSLYIAHVHVGRGPKIKRMRFASRSKMHAYVKHRSFVKVILTTK